MKALYRSRVLPGTALLILVAGATYACKDFLEAPPQGALDESTLANQAGVEGSLIAAYRALDWNNGVGGDWGNAASNWVWGNVPSDDGHTGSYVSDQPPITETELYNWSSSAVDNYLRQKWSGSFEGVVRANATLRLLDKVVAEKPNEITEANQDGIRGEALFLRAHYHFEAWKMWGNIPYYNETDTDFRKTNVGVAAIDSILRDLGDAIALLPATPRNGQVGRVTSWTAKAYKGKVQMYDGDYAGALITLRDVRNNGPYDLEADYRRVWSGYEAYANGPETILAFQASVGDGEPNGNNGNYGERLNFPHSGSPFGCCGFNQPTQNLVNLFQVDDDGLPLSLSDPNWNARSTNLDAAASATMRLDPRLDWTAARDGVPVKDWGPHAPGWIRDYTFGGFYSYKKILYEQGSGAFSTVGWVGTQLTSMNLHIYRYADALLFLAEANVEGGGSLAEACQIVNEIRTRAGVVAQGPGTSAANVAVPIDDASITWADYEVGLYECPFASQSYAREAVRTERRLELGQEGHRFFDLRRWGFDYAKQVIDAYLAAEKLRTPFLAAAPAFASRYMLYPIPTLEISLSKVGEETRLQQNEGW